MAIIGGAVAAGTFLGLSAAAWAAVGVAVAVAAAAATAALQAQAQQEQMRQARAAADAQANALRAQQTALTTARAPVRWDTSPVNPPGWWTVRVRGSSPDVSTIATAPDLMTKNFMSC